MKSVTIETIVKVPFYDLDPMNIVWHGNYFKYLEVARCDFFKKLGYDYMQMYSDNIMYPIAKMDFKFIKSARFEDNLLIKTTLKELEPALTLKYEIFLNNDKILSANTMQIAVDAKTGESLFEAPEKLKRLVDEYVE